MSAPDFSQFLLGLGGDGLLNAPAPLPSSPVPAPPAPIVPPSMSPVAAPQPQIASQHGVDWGRAVGPLAAIALALSGHPNAATGAATGAMLAERQRRDDLERQAEQQAQLARAQAEQARIVAEAEARRQAEIQKLMLTAAQTLPNAKNKAEYDQQVGILEGLGAPYGMRPNTIRAQFRYMAPNANTVMEDAAQKFLKNPANQQAIEQGNLSGSIMLDVQGDGKPIAVPVMDVLKAGGVQFDPGTGKPIVLGKQGKTDVPLDREAFLGAVAQFEADKGRPATQIERGQIAEQLQRKPVDPNTEELRRLNVELARQRVDQAKNAGLPLQAQRRVDMKAKAFDASPVVKRYQTQSEAANFVQSLDNNSKNPADDQALIYAFAKAMDPDSAVREGEYNTVHKYAQSWLQNLGVNLARVVDNHELLTPEARANLKATIQKRYQASRGQYDAARQSFASQINRITGGTDGDTYLIDYAAAAPDSTDTSTVKTMTQDAQPGELRKLPDGRIVRITEKTRTGFKFDVVK